MSGVPHVIAVANAGNAHRELSLMPAPEVKSGTGVGGAILRPRGMTHCLVNFRAAGSDGNIVGQLPAIYGAGPRAFRTICRQKRSMVVAGVFNDASAEKEDPFPGTRPS